jgi:SAM-dependent methyltransferase
MWKRMGKKRMSNKETSSDRPYLEPYEKATREMGAGFEAQLWMSRDAQKTRFEVLDEMGHLSNRVVADLGCGQGDLAIYLSEKYQLHEKENEQGFPKQYIGIEGVQAMADHARTRILSAGVHRAIIDVGDFVADGSLPELLINEANVEVFLFSGSLNTLSMIDAQNVLHRFWSAIESSGRGTLIFNFLSNRHNRERTPANAPAVRFDPAQMLDWALERTPLVQMRHDYLAGHDATIVMHAF